MATVKSLPLVEASILGPIVDWLDENGANTEQHLERACIPGELIASGGLLSKSQLYGFLSDVVDRERCEELGFASYRRFQLDTLGTMAHAMRSAATFKESLDVFSRLASRSYDGNVFWLSEDGDDVWFCNRVVDNVRDGHVYAQHASLMILMQIVRAVAGNRWQPRRARLQAPETNILLRTNVLKRCQVMFSQGETAVAFPRHLLGQQLGDGEGESAHEQVGIEGGRGDNQVEEDGFAGALQRLLKSQLPHTGLPTVSKAANIAGTSERTIRRRLYDEGVTYRELLDRIRYDSAREMLKDQGLSVTDIAAGLGYSGPNNFIRAFRRLAGVTPTEYRKELREE